MDSFVAEQKTIMSPDFFSAYAPYFALLFAGFLLLLVIFLIVSKVRKKDTDDKEEEDAKDSPQKTVKEEQREIRSELKKEQKRIKDEMRQARKEDRDEKVRLKEEEKLEKMKNQLSAAKMQSVRSNSQNKADLEEQMDKGQSAAGTGDVSEVKQMNELNKNSMNNPVNPQTNPPTYPIKGPGQKAARPAIQFDGNNRAFYYNQNGYATYCDLQGNAAELDRQGHQVFYDQDGYPFFYKANGQIVYYNQRLIEYDANGYVIAGKLYDENAEAPFPIEQASKEMTDSQARVSAPELLKEEKVSSETNAETPVKAADAPVKESAEIEIEPEKDTQTVPEEKKKGKFGKKNKSSKAPDKKKAVKEKKSKKSKKEKNAAVNEAQKPKKGGFKNKFRKKDDEEIFTSVEIEGSSDALLANAVDMIYENHPHEEKETTPKTKKELRAEKKAAKKSSAALKQKGKKLKIPKTVQESIPYLAVYPEDGIIEIEEGVYSKSYLLSDVNYSIAKDQEQEEMFVNLGKLYNSFDHNVRFQITLNQRKLNMEDFEKEVLLEKQNDGLDDLREERNEMLKAKMSEGKNNLVIDKYLTISVKAPDIHQARNTFARLDGEITVNVKKIGGAGATVISSADRLEILHDIYNSDSIGLFGNNFIQDEDGEYVLNPEEKFSFSVMNRMGLTTKDVIGPESIQFKIDHGKVGNKFFRTLYLHKIPSYMPDNFLAELSKTECSMITSLHFQPVPSDKAVKMATDHSTNLSSNLIDKQKKASKAGYSYELTSRDLNKAVAENEELISDLTSKDQQLFLMTFVIAHFADSLDKLKSDTEIIRNIARRFSCDIRPLTLQMENGLQSALPLANNKLAIRRSLTTESAAVFMPFVNQELKDRNGGMYYGNNAVSNNLILFNRRNSKNGNGFIFGVPGAGKSMSAKQEMMTVLLSSPDDVIVIDPEAEYYPMAQLLGGQVIRIAAGENNHINPFDINLDNNLDFDPIANKSDFIVSLCEVIGGGVGGLTPTQRSIIDRCVKQSYEPLLNSKDPVTGEYDYEKTPTLVEFWELLRQQSGYDAMQLAESLEIYVKGSLNVFAHKTNVEYTDRFVVYDIKDIGSTMMQMGLLVVLDNIWNRIVEGRDKGKHVWFFIDEIYLLFKTKSSAEFLRNVYKRARKYGGLPTGITQNVTDLLENDIARTMISNSEYILMLSQSALDRDQLGMLINISPAQMEFVINAEPGTGLLYDGKHIVPFVNRLPKETKQYRAMTTKLEEVRERQAEEALAEGQEKEEDTVSAS